MVKQDKLHGNVSWTCVSCAAFADGFAQKVKEIESRVEKVEGTTEGNKNDLKKTNDKLDQLQTTVNKLKVDQQKVAQTTSGASAESVYTELREREDRRAVVVIHNVPEPDAALKEKQQRIDADIAKLQAMLNELELDDDKANIKFAARLGAPGDAPRPLRVGFKTVGLRTNVVEAGRNLATKVGWESVTVVPDLTKIQRQYEKQLRDEVSKLNDERTADEQKNFEWKVVGPRGERRKVKGKSALGAQAAAAAGPTPLATVRAGSPRMTRQTAAGDRGQKGYRGRCQ